MSEHVWAKVYLELPTDPKLVGRSAHDCYLWVCLILLAKSSDGMVMPWQAQAKYLSKYSRIGLKEVTQALVYFEDVGMIQLTPDGGLVLPHFAKRQQKIDGTAAERQARKRDRERDVTDMSRRDVTPTRAHKEADRTTSLRSSVLPEEEAEADSLGQRSAANAPKVAFDPGQATEYAAAQGFDEFAITKMQRRFLDHHAAGGWKRTGGVVIKDRMAAWRTWVGNELDRKPPSGNPGSPAAADGLTPEQREDNQRRREAYFAEHPEHRAAWEAEHPDLVVRSQGEAA